MASATEYGLDALGAGTDLDGLVVSEVLPGWELTSSTKAVRVGVEQAALNRTSLGVG